MWFPFYSSLGGTCSICHRYRMGTSITLGSWMPWWSRDPMLRSLLGSQVDNVQVPRFWSWFVTYPSLLCHIPMALRTKPCFFIMAQKALQRLNILTSSFTSKSLIASSCSLILNHTALCVLNFFLRSVSTLQGIPPNSLPELFLFFLFPLNGTAHQPLKVSPLSYSICPYLS